MPNQRKPDRPRVQFVCSQELADDLQQWADSESRSRSNLIEKLLQEVVEQNKNSQSLSKSELIDQMKRFISLLLGEQDRNGVSYVSLGRELNIDSEKLHDLFLLMQQCRAESTREKTK